jgi:hypothetical protein
MRLDEMLWNKNYIKSSIMKDPVLAAQMERVVGRVS